MSAYVIVDIKVKNPIRYEEYKKMAEATVKQFGGKYIVRGKPAEILEPGWTPNRLVILEFPSVEQAKLWWNSDEYAEAKRLRYETADSTMIVVEGI
ncbi:MAG: DUF1330 domain-containing protein [Ignavibacteriales bacterium]|nr:DUF1330 domain-containing protein [Ignavibacteriales bacterium]